MNCFNLTEVMQSCPNNTMCDCYSGAFGGFTNNLSWWQMLLIIGGVVIVISYLIIKYIPHHEDCCQ
jgi:hypothetical protein